MGRLDNIIARNRRPNRLHERLTVSLVLGAIVLLILALAVFTDLGLPPEARDARGGPGEPRPRGDLLVRQPAVARSEAAQHVQAAPEGADELAVRRACR